MTGQATKCTQVIFDLDGTLLDTESLVTEVSKIIVERYGKAWHTGGVAGRLGKRPLDGAAMLVEEFGLPCTPQEYLSQSLTLLQDRWKRAKALPGADRLLRHLAEQGVPMALASSSPRRNITAKLSYHPEWLKAFAETVAGDEVEHGKPAPDIFLRAASLLGADPAACLVVEDAPAGVAAGKAAGMQVLAVPSISKKQAKGLYDAADCQLSSLLDVRPELWGLPPFTDWVTDALPLAPWYMGGKVVKGFGRGSKVLGIPTANLPPDAIASHVAEHVCGIYLGWAGLSHRGVFKMVMSVGWNPYFDNEQKTVEPWLLHDFGEDFYGEELRLVVVGYIRPEANFPSLEALVARIHKDGDIARAALSTPPYLQFSGDPYLTTPLP